MEPSQSVRADLTCPNGYSFLGLHASCEILGSLQKKLVLLGQAAEVRYAFGRI